MPGDFVDRVVPIFSSSSTGQVKHTQCTSIEVSAPERRSAVRTMAGLKGYTEKTPDAFGVTIEVAVPKNPSEIEVDYHDFWASGERFLITYREGETGVKRQLSGCVVNTVSDPYDADGEMRRKIDAMALAFRRVPGA